MSTHTAGGTGPSRRFAGPALRRHLVHACAAVTLVAPVSLTTACRWWPPPPPADDCGWMSSSGAATGRTAMLVDVSRSTGAGATASVGTVDYAAATSKLLGAAVERSDTVSVGSFSGTRTDLNWVHKGWSTDWKKDNPNPDNQHDRKEQATSCLGKAVSTARTAPAPLPGTDVLSALRAAGDLVRGSGPAHLIVATDGLSTTGCADLTRAGFRSQTELESIVRLCTGETKGVAATPEIVPDELRGVDVTFVGLGYPAADQPVPDAGQTQWLRQLWSELCAKAGAAQCRIDPAPPGAVTGSPAASTGESKADPPVSFGADRIVYHLPAAALFDTGAPTLRAEAGPLLADIAVSIRSRKGVKVQVNGYADPRGDAQDNLTLSQRRADSVRQALLDNQVVNVTAAGLGETTSCPDGVDGQGATGLQCDRRVDIIVSPA